MKIKLLCESGGLTTINEVRAIHIDGWGNIFIDDVGRMHLEKDNSKTVKSPTHLYSKAKYNGKV